MSNVLLRLKAVLVCIANCGWSNRRTVVQDASTISFVNHRECLFCANPVGTSNVFSMLLHFCNFSLVLFIFSPKLSILLRIPPSTWTLDFTGVGGLLIESFGSNLDSLLQILNTVALVFSAYNSSCLHSCYSCKVFRYGVIMSRNLSTSGWDAVKANSSAYNVYIFRGR